MIKIMIDLQPQALDDYGNSRLQLKIDMIERDAFEKCREILNQNLKNQPGFESKQQKTETEDQLKECNEQLGI